MWGREKRNRENPASQKVKNRRRTRHVIVGITARRERFSLAPRPSQTNLQFKDRKIAIINKPSKQMLMSWRIMRSKSSSIFTLKISLCSFRSIGGLRGAAFEQQDIFLLLFLNLGRAENKLYMRRRQTIILILNFCSSLWLGGFLSCVRNYITNLFHDLWLTKVPLHSMPSLMDLSRYQVPINRIIGDFTLFCFHHSTRSFVTNWVPQLAFSFWFRGDNFFAGCWRQTFHDIFTDLWESFTGKDFHTR